MGVSAMGARASTLPALSLGTHNPLTAPHSGPSRCVKATRAASGGHMVTAVSACTSSRDRTRVPRCARPSHRQSTQETTFRVNCNRRLIVTAGARYSSSVSDGCASLLLRLLGRRRCCSRCALWFALKLRNAVVSLYSMLLVVAAFVFVFLLDLFRSG